MGHKGALLFDEGKPWVLANRAQSVCLPATSTRFIRGRFAPASDAPSHFRTRGAQQRPKPSVQPQSRAADEPRSITGARSQPILGYPHGLDGHPLFSQDTPMALRILLYDFGSDDAATTASWRQSLTAAEQGAFTQRATERQRGSLVARALLRRELGQRLGCAPHHVPIARGAQGKPYLAGAHDWHFNLAHSGQYVALAFSHEGPVGIDIEWRQRRSRVDALARHFFGAHERQGWDELPAHTRQYRFFQLWTLKEAMAKALGASVWSTLSNAQWTGLGRRDSRIALYGTAAPSAQVAWWHLDLGDDYSLGVVHLGAPNTSVQLSLLGANGGQTEIPWRPDVEGASQAGLD